MNTEIQMKRQKNRSKGTLRLILGALPYVAAAAVLVGPSPARADLRSPYEGQVQLGPSLGINGAPGQLHLGMDFGADPSRTLSFILPFELGLGGGITRIQLEPGAEGHFRLISGHPLYLVPRAGLGLGILTGCCQNSGSDFALALNAGLELRYVIKENVASASFQPVRFDVYPFGTNQSGAVPAWYAMLIGVTANF